MQFDICTLANFVIQMSPITLRKGPCFLSSFARCSRSKFIRVFYLNKCIPGASSTWAVQQILKRYKKIYLFLWKPETLIPFKFVSVVGFTAQTSSAPAFLGTLLERSFFLSWATVASQSAGACGFLFDSNRVPFGSVFSSGNSRQCHWAVSGDEGACQPVGMLCLAVKSRIKWATQNGRVRFDDDAAKFSLPTDPAVFPVT